MTSQLIAIVDDEADIVKLVSLHAKRAGYDVAEFFNAQDFYHFLEKKRPDLVVLDLMLPDENGLEVCKKLRAQAKFKNLPIIMLTAKSEEIDKILGLELGADDYVTKPFSPREVMARIKSVLRRSKELPKVLEDGADVINLDDVLVINKKTHEVFAHSRLVTLTSAEFRLLTIMAEKRKWVFSREKLLDILWGDEKTVVEKTIDVHIRHLREKLGEAGQVIKSIRGVGYKIE